MRHSSTFFESVVQTIREPLLVLHADLRVLMANPAFYHTFRTERSATEGHHLYELGSGEWRIPMLQRLLEEIIPANSSVEDFEVTHAFEALGTRTMVLNARRINPTSADPALILLAIEDVTEQKRSHSERERLMAELTRSNQELERFAYVASHDLQEPLRMVTSFTQLLARRYRDRLDEKATRYIEHAVDGATRMQVLINDLLAYSRVGAQPPPRVPVELGAVMDQVRRNLQVTVRDAEAVVTCDPLPTVQGDPTELVQLFQNLVSNAIKFRGAEPPHVHVSARRQEGEWVVSVRDNGIGIDPQYFERVFALFQRLHARTAYPGTGIGLAVCRKIVERSGGRIWIESTPGTGTTFFFTQPAGEAE